MLNKTLPASILNQSCESIDKYTIRNNFSLFNTYQPQTQAAKAAFTS